MRNLNGYQKSVGSWGLLISLMAFTIMGCGNPRSPENQVTRSAAPQAAAGQSVVYGAVVVVPGQCQGATLVNMTIVNTNNNYSSQHPSTSAYQIQITPGEYVFTATASTCIFTKNFRVASDESLPIDVILQ